MAQLILNDINLSFGGRKIFKGINFHLSELSRTALTGTNGSGKSTLMKIMADLMEADSGSVNRSKNCRVGYLPQSGIVHKDSTLREETEKAYQDIVDKVDELDTLSASLEQDPESLTLLQKHHELQEAIINSGYYDRERHIGRVLKGLGFSEEDNNRNCSEFSGGWQMRIALTKLLLRSPDILLLDEPTNYLDLEARDWLRAFLADYPGGLLIVSHDKYFLDNTIKEVAELFMGQLNISKGNYSFYIEKRRLELEALEKQYVKQQEDIKKTEDFIRRFRYNAAKATQVQSRVKMLEKIELIEIPPGISRMHLTLPQPPHSGKTSLTLRNINRHYGDFHVLKDVNMEVPRGEKMVISGVNGAGKSTLLRIIANQDNDFEGQRIYGKDISIGYFSQDHHLSLPDELSVLECLEEEAPTHLIPRLRDMLGAFLFRGDDVYKKVAVLSGGEKNRLSLLRILLKPFNLLILDEPTNHLDIQSKEVLLEAMKLYEGTLIFVSHDRDFIERLATRVLELEYGKGTFFQGDYAYYQWKKNNDSEENPEAGLTGEDAEAPVKTDNQLNREELKQLKTKLRKLEREEQDLLARIDETETMITGLEEAMSKPENYSDGEKITGLQKQKTSCEEEYDQLTGQWETVSSEVEEVQGKLEVHF